MIRTRAYCSGTIVKYRSPYPSKQIAFHELFVAAPATILNGALTNALGIAHPDQVRRALSRLARALAQGIYASASDQEKTLAVLSNLLHVGGLLREPTTVAA